MQDFNIILTSGNIEGGLNIIDSEGHKWKIIKQLGKGRWVLYNLHQGKRWQKALFYDEYTHYHLLN